MTGRLNRTALAAVPVAVVALMAGKVSYSHITALGLRTHQGWSDSHLLFVPIDGLIVAGTVLLFYGYLLGWLGVGLGVAATLFANLQFGLPHGPLSAAVSTWPAVAFSVACFMLERWLRSRRKTVTGESVTVPRESVTADTPAAVNGSRPQRARESVTGATNRELAAAQGISLSTFYRRRNGSAVPS